MDNFVRAESRLAYVAETVGLSRFEESDSSFQTRKFAQQLLEYSPIQTLPYLQRWITSYSALAYPYQVVLKDTLKVVTEGPVAKSFIADLKRICAHLGLSYSFAGSQVRNPLHL